MSRISTFSSAGNGKKADNRGMDTEKEMGKCMWLYGRYPL